MKLLFIFINIGVLLLTNPSSAQTITGLVKGGNGEKMESISVILLKANDSSLVKGAITNNNGKYEFSKIVPGNYFISASAIGFIKTNTTIFYFKGDNYSAEPVLLKKSASDLKEVIVTTTKPLIEVKADKLIFNVEGSINATGLSALELLQKSPGVQVDQDDNVLIEGKQGVKIYIDGKPSPLAGRDLASVLKGMQSSDIEAIEIITNPSAKYDAAGNVGIINIRLKKNKKLGTNGNIAIMAGEGITPKIDLSTSLNYRNKKWNVFGNFSYGQGIWHNSEGNYRILNTTAYNTSITNERIDKYLNFKTGADYFINSKNSIGIVVNGSNSNHNSISESKTLIGSENNAVSDSAILTASSNTPGTSLNLNYNVNYRFADTSGHELTINADAGMFNGTTNLLQPNYYTYLNPVQLPYSLVYQQSTPTKINIISFKADYEQPFFKGKLGYGVKASSVKSDNTIDAYNIVSNMAVLDTGKSNRFTYTEQVFAGYINYNKELNKKWSLQAGLRAEQTFSLGNLVSFKFNALNKVDTSYLNFFPSFALTYITSKNNALNLNYSRRINRPSYQDLNPFEYRVDELTYRTGNPFLKPRYTNRIKLTNSFKSKLTTSVSYYYTSNDYNGISRIDSGKIYNTIENFSHSQGISLNASLNLPITKWWDLNYNFWYQNSAIHGLFSDGSTYNVHNSNFGFNGSTTFKFNTSSTLELSGYYNSRFNWIYVNRPQGMMDIGFKKKLLKDHADIKFSIRDILNTAGYSALFVHNGIYQYIHGDWEARRYAINFNYRFGSKDIKNARVHNGSAEDELDRIKK